MGFTTIDYKIQSTHTIYAVYNGEDYEVDTLYTFPMSMDPVLGLHHTSDVTEFFEENDISVEESRAVHYEVQTSQMPRC